MSPLYDQISENRNRTLILIVLFVVLFAGMGWVYGEYTGVGMSAAIAAVGIALLITLFSYYNGDSIALWTSGAQGPIKKEDAPNLYRIIENLSIAAGLPMPKVYMIADGAINAFATGRDPKHASIAVTTGAIERLEKIELEGVLAHELSHVKNYDIRYMLLVAVLVGALVMLASWLRHAFFWGGKRRNNENNGNGIVLIIGLVFAILAPLFAQLIKLAISRQREYLADASGALLSRYPEGLARALEKIQQDKDPLDHANEATAHLYFASPFGDIRSKLTGLFSTHPPINARVARLRGMTTPKV